MILTAVHQRARSRRVVSPTWVRSASGTGPGGVRLLLQAGADPNRLPQAGLYGAGHDGDPRWPAVYAAVRSGCPATPVTSTRFLSACLHTDHAEVRRRPAGIPRREDSSQRHDAGGCGFACFVLVDASSVTALVVNDHRAAGGQDGAGRPVVMAAQQEINRMRTSRGGRDEDAHHRPGRAAAGVIPQGGWPVPVSLVFGRGSCHRVVGEPTRFGPAARKPHAHPASVGQPGAAQ